MANVHHLHTGEKKWQPNLSLKNQKELKQNMHNTSILLKLTPPPEVVAVMNKLYRNGLQGEKPENLYITIDDADLIRRLAKQPGSSNVSKSHYLKLTPISGDTRRQDSEEAARLKAIAEAENTKYENERKRLETDEREKGERSAAGNQFSIGGKQL